MVLLFCCLLFAVCRLLPSAHAPAAHGQNSYNDVNGDSDRDREPILPLFIDSAFVTDHGCYSERSPDENRGPQAGAVFEDAERGNGVGERIARYQCPEDDEHHWQKLQSL